MTWETKGNLDNPSLFSNIIENLQNMQKLCVSVYALENKILTVLTVLMCSKAYKEM